MSTENTQKVRDMYAAFARGDVPFVIGSLDPHVEWNEAENFIYWNGGPFIGPDAVLKDVFMRLGMEWENFTVTPEEIISEGDTVIGRGRYRGKYSATGVAVDAQFVHVFKFKDGKVAFFQDYTDTAQFREAVTRSQPTSA